MPKFIIVGHPSSGYETINALLLQHGMAAALPTQRDQFTPCSLGALLCKVHSCVPLDSMASCADSGPHARLEQIDVASVWNGLAMDLLLSNLEQEFWGWADPNAIHLLEYWEQQDPLLKFIFVYNTPESAFTFTQMLDGCDGTRQHAENMAEHVPHTPDQLAQQWSAFNATMLQFFHHHPERCVLIHAERVRAHSSANVADLEQLLNAPLPALESLQLAPTQVALTPFSANQGDDAAFETATQVEVPVDAADTETTESEKSLPTAEAEAEAETHESIVAVSQSSPHELLKRHLARDLVGQYPHLRQIYEELQSVANWPLANDEQTNNTPPSIQIWQAMQSIRRMQADAALRYQQRETELIEQAALLQHTHTQAVQHHQQRETGLIEQAAQLEARLQQTQTQAAQRYQQRETELIGQATVLKDQLQQLQQLQQQAQKQASHEQAKSLQSAQRHRAREKELETENQLLIKQLHHVQQELERHRINFNEDNELAAAQHRLPRSKVKRQRTPNAFLSPMRQLTARLQARTLTKSGVFDPTWYLAENPDVAQLPVFAKNPALHYLLHGAQENRAPSSRFSHREYLREHPEARH